MLDEATRDGSRDGNSAAVKESPDLYYPSAEVVQRAIVKDWSAIAQEALNDPQKFWAERAEELEWFQKWDTVLDETNKPFYKWFVGGKTNIIHNAIDRHLHTYRKNKLAFIWQGEDGSE